MNENKTLKSILIVVVLLTLISIVLAVKEYVSYTQQQGKYEEYCDTYDKLWENNSEIYYQLEEAGVKIDNNKLADEY